jgi:hypothetical protein
VEQRVAKAVDSLVALGYDTRPKTIPVPPTGSKIDRKDRASSIFKFILFDKNYAYFWFNHFLLGIQYCSKNFLGNSAMNDFSPHGLEFRPVFNPTPAESAAFPPVGYYDTAERSKEDGKPFVADNSLLGNNVLGFKPASTFAVSLGTNVERNLQAATWCELFLYREDDVVMAKLRANY